MPQRNLGRSVARAAASGGGKAYRARPAVGWYITMLAIVIVGVSLIVYSRQETLHPKTTATKSTEGPTATDSWHAALSIDICGKVQPNLPQNSNLAKTALRTFGDGLIYIQPGVVAAADQKNFEGKKATLAAFVSNYPKMKMTSKTLQTPTSKLYTTGDICGTLPKNATAAQKAAATGTVVIETWASPTAQGVLLGVGDPTKVHLGDGEMISIGFLTPSQTLPVPASKSALVSVLGPASSTTTTSTTVPKPPTAEFTTTTT